MHRPFSRRGPIAGKRAWPGPRGRGGFPSPPTAYPRRPAGRDPWRRFPGGAACSRETRCTIHPPRPPLRPPPLPPPAARGPGRREGNMNPPAEADLVVRVVDHVSPRNGGVSLAEAKVIVSGGRGVGSKEGFAIIEDLAGLLGAAVGCSRAVASAGWRPHSDQVGQTGTKVAPDVYIACGISGATQHMAGLKGAKRILAINSDPQAPLMLNADYTVTGDLKEIVPAISAEIRKRK